MEVKMPVGVDVVESKAGFLVCTKLGFNLCSQLRAHRWLRAYLSSKPREVVAQMSPCVNEIGQALRR